MRYQTQTQNIHNFYHKKKKGKLNLNAHWQRDFVWNAKTQAYLIDSILRNIPIPKISIQISLDGVWTIVDGKQRLMSIFNFAGYLSDDEKVHVSKEPLRLPVNADPIMFNGKSYDVANKTYDELDPLLQEAFDGKGLSCDEIECDESEVADYFQRINNGVALSSFDKRNSILGNIHNTIEELRHHDMAKLMGKISNKATKHKAYCERIIFISINGINNLDHKSLVEFHIKNKTINLDNIKEKIVSTLDILYSIFKPSNGRKNKMPYQQTGEGVSLFKIFFDRGKFFVDANDIIKWYVDSMEERQKNEKYLGATLANTISKDNIQTVYDVLVKSLDEYITSGKIRVKDSKRLFSDEQKIQIFAKGKGVCQECKKVLYTDPFHADHIYAHTKGGKTTIENGQLLCIPCNLAKSSN